VFFQPLAASQCSALGSTDGAEFILAFDERTTPVGINIFLGDRFFRAHAPDILAQNFRCSSRAFSKTRCPISTIFQSYLPGTSSPADQAAVN